jgi:hypothetical protein
VTSESVHLINDVVKGTVQATEELGGGLTWRTKSVAKGVITIIQDVLSLLSYFMAIRPFLWIWPRALS